MIVGVQGQVCVSRQGQEAEGLLVTVPSAPQGSGTCSWLPQEQSPHCHGTSDTGRDTGLSVTQDTQNSVRGNCGARPWGPGYL